MNSSIISVIEDLLDQYEDSVYNHEDSYKINEHRRKVMFALRNLLTTEQIEIKNIYRFKFHSDITGDSIYSGFYKNEIDAYDFLDDFKEKIRENHEEWNRYHVGDIIELQEVVLEDVEDIDYTSRAKVVSEIVVDDEASEEKRLELAECRGIAAAPEDYQIVCWKDYEVE